MYMQVHWKIIQKVTIIITRTRTLMAIVVIERANVIFLLILEHQTQHTTCFMIKLTLKHNTTIIPFSILASLTKKEEK